MKIGITQIILGSMSLEDTLRLCEDAGYQAVELVFAEGKDLDPSMSASEIAQVGRQCADAGVEIGSVIVWYPERGNPAQPRCWRARAVPQVLAALA